MGSLIAEIAFGLESFKLVDADVAVQLIGAPRMLWSREADFIGRMIGNLDRLAACLGIGGLTARGDDPHGTAPRTRLAPGRSASSARVLVRPCGLLVGGRIVEPLANRCWHG